MAGRHRSGQNAKKTLRKASTNRLRDSHRDPYRWLGAGAVTLGLGVVLAGGTGVASAVTGDESTSTSSSASDSGSDPGPRNSNESDSPSDKSSDGAPEKKAASIKDDDDDSDSWDADEAADSFEGRDSLKNEELNEPDVKSSERGRFAAAVAVEIDEPDAPPADEEPVLASAFVLLPAREADDNHPAHIAQSSGKTTDQTPNTVTSLSLDTATTSSTSTASATASPSVIASIPVGFGPLAAVVSANGKYAYVANQDGRVTVIDTEKHVVVKTLNIGGANPGTRQQHHRAGIREHDARLGRTLCDVLHDPRDRQRNQCDNWHVHCSPSWGNKIGGHVRW